jgi:hypothetical protein
VPTSRSYRGIAASDGLFSAYDPMGNTRPYDQLRRRATSDPRAPATQTNGTAIRPQTSIERDLARADRVRQQRKWTLTPADISRRDRELAAAEDELRERLQQISQAGMDITRRLDYGYYNLLEKSGNLTSVLHSLQGVATQSGHLIENLEQESKKTDGQIRGRTGQLRKAFDERGKRAVQLEERGKAVQRRAEELGNRLESARAQVEAWEAREIKRQQVWGRFVARVWWTVCALVVLIVALVVAREWLLGDVEPPRPAHAQMSPNETIAWDLQAARARVPEDVSQLLLEIEQRNGKVPDHEPVVDLSSIRDQGGPKTPEPEALRALDEL